MSVLQLVNGVQRAIASTVFGRGLLSLADAAALRTAAGIPTDSVAIDLGVYSVVQPYETYAYGGGRLTQVQLRTAPNGGGTLLLQENYTYNAQGQLTQIVVIDGAVTRTEVISYNGDGTIQTIGPT